MKNQTRNLAILSDERIHTIKAYFDNTPDKGYVYLAKREWGIKEGDYILTPKGAAFSYACVEEVHDEADIDVTAEINYRFCNGKVLFLAAEEEEKLDKAEGGINKQRNKAARKQLREQLMTGLLESTDE